MTSDEEILARQRGILRLSKGVIARALADDPRGVSRLVSRVERESGAQGVHTLCHHLAQMFLVATSSAPNDPARVELTFAVGDDTVDPEDLPAELQPMVWATRFLSAFSAGDMASTTALFQVSRANPRRHPDDVRALADLAVAPLRQP